MGRVSAATEVVLGTPQAISLAGGALLVTLLDYHVIYGVMAVVTATAAAYLLVVLGRQVWQPIRPWAAPSRDEPHLDDLSAPHH
jgi:hypothetical protein